MGCLGRLRVVGAPLLVALVATILAPAGPTDAQVLYGSLVGRVSDTSQAVVPGAMM